MSKLAEQAERYDGEFLFSEMIAWPQIAFEWLTSAHIFQKWLPIWKKLQRYVVNTRFDYLLPTQKLRLSDLIAVIITFP